MPTAIERRLLPRPRRASLDEGTMVTPRPGGPRTVVDRSLPPEGYRLAVSSDGTVDLAAADEAGLFYGRATLEQLVRVSGGALPTGTIEDWPDLAVRGVMLDVSRCKVPTLETLYGLVDRLSSWKVNHLELYTEHTFAYAGHEDVWRDADPYDLDDLTSLAAYCRERHVELVPNQNCLGHTERWLVHDRYAPLGISRGVVSGPLGIPMPASTLDPAHPGSLPLVTDLLAQLCGTLPGGRVHVGLDEPWDLPKERAPEWRTWLERLRALPELSGRDMLVWGDMLAIHPELARELREDVVVCEWGYESNHPFADRLATLAGAGARRWVAPGTSSWMSVLGRTTNALDNCRAAAAAAAGGGAEGMLVTDWGDFGHLQYLPVSDPGLAAAAAMSWCGATNGELDAGTLAGLLDAHCFADDAGELGRALMDLGDVHTLQPCTVPNISGLVLHLYFPQLPVGTGFPENVTQSHLDQVESAIEAALGAAGRARPATTHGTLAVDELATAGGLVRHLCADARARIGGDGSIAGIPATVRTALADDVDGLVAAHRERWTARNRTGGLEESCLWLTNLRDAYRRGEADPHWAGPLVQRIRAGEPSS